MEKPQMAVKLFRDKEAWEAQKDTVMEVRTQLNAANQRREELAKKSDLNINDVYRNLDSRLLTFYPQLDMNCEADKEVYYAWGGPGNDVRGVTISGIPNIVLEEIAFVRELRLFSRICYDRTLGGTTFFGKNDDDVICLIAYYGSRERYDQIQTKISDLRKKREEAALAVVKTEVTKPPKPAFGKANFVFAAIAIVITAAAGATLLVAVCATISGNVETDKDTARMLEKLSGQPVDVSMAGDREVELHNKKHLNPLSTTAQFRDGEVVDKISLFCRYCNGGRYYYLYIRDGRLKNGSIETLVTKDVFDKLKVGDQVPPAKAPEKAAPEKRDPQDF